jgi:hypothetical protein
MPFKAVTEGEYKGKPTLSIYRNEEDNFPFSFGVGKAKLMVKHIEAIKKFVKQNTIEKE